MTACFPISPLDSFHLGVAHDHVGCLWLLDSMPEVGALEAAARRLSIAIPRMRASLDRQSRCWREQSGFDPEEHIVHVPLSADLAAVLTRLSELYLAPLLEGRPPWKAILLPIDGQGPGLCFLAHHAFTDGVRGFHLARAFAGQDMLASTSIVNRRNGIDVAAAIEMVRVSLADVVRPSARALPKFPDSGQRAFHSAIISAATIQSATRKVGSSRTDLLAHTFARVLAQRFDSRKVTLMVPRNVGGDNLGGNYFLPELRVFRFDGRSAARNNSPTRRLTTRAAADRLRMSIMARLPVQLADASYHRWANSFDALCTIIPNLFTGSSVAGARVIAAFGIPPLIWRQPLSAALIVGRMEVSLLVASDPTAIDGAVVLKETVRALEGMT